MKRFFCTVCKKIKHVRVLPGSVEPLITNPIDRTGICRWHEGVARGKVRIVARIGSTKKLSAAQQKSKSK